MIAIDLSKKKQILDTDPKAIQQINITGNLEKGRNAADKVINVDTICFSSLKKWKKPF